MRNGFLSLVHTGTHPPPPFLLVVHRRPPPAIPHTVFFSRNPTHRIHTKSRRWDSNAETFRTQNFDFSSLDDDDDDFEDDNDDDTTQWLDILEDFIDGVWIFKVFRSFGWMLPAIISSLLLTSGPKAFLMALALPLAQSALSFVFQFVSGRPKNRANRRGKSKRKRPPPRPSASYVDLDNEEEEYIKGGRKGKMGYQTWVAGDDVSDDKKRNGSSSFGGWEELERGVQFNTTSMKNPNGKPKTSKSKLSRREKRSNTPLFLRLLIAVFPFLGSWTRML